MLKWLINHSRWVLNNKGQLFSPQGLQTGVARQVGGLRQLGLSELQRRQQLQSQLQLLQFKQQLIQQDPMQQLLQRGQAAQAIQNISELGGDVSQFQGLFGGGAGIAVPTAMPTAAQAPVGRPTITGAPVAGVEPVTPEIRPTKFERTPFGQLRPTAFERVATQEELDREAEQSARAAGIKQQVLDKLKGMPGESAAKLTMIQQALSDLEGVEEQLFTPEGKFRRGLAFAANIPGGQAFGIGRVIPDVGFGTEARILNSRMNNALEAKLRIETGAAATQEEFNRLQTRFGVTGFDTPESARNKIKRLKEFMRSAIITIDPTGRFTYKTDDIKLDKELNVDIPQLQSLGLDPNRFEIIGEE